MNITNLHEIFGNIDIYLFDQMLKGRFGDEMSVLDAGCGGGRNLIYFLRSGYQVFGIDQNWEAVEQIRQIAKMLNLALSPENFQTSTVEKIPFKSDKFDLVISSAVLHFARNAEHFNAMFCEMGRVLKSGGILFARLASSIGIESLITPIGDGRYFLPDGSERFLVDEETLLALTEMSGASLLEPLKTTNVQNLRAMTTWVLQKS